MQNIGKFREYQTTHEYSYIIHLLCPSFGSLISNRSWSDASRVYRYGFNGKEKDFETSSDYYDFGARIYDGRLGRWLSLDPLMSEFPHFSSYSYCANIPILLVDFIGLKIINPYEQLVQDV
jgi:RHS repeat-associated protein